MSAAHAVPAEVRLYDRLFTHENPATVKDESEYRALINPDSLQILRNCMLEPGLSEIEPGVRLQFERLGYFVKDVKDSTPERPVFNRTVTLKDSWARIERIMKGRLPKTDPDKTK